jgi:hypothetical protein
MRDTHLVTSRRRLPCVLFKHAKHPACRTVQNRITIEATLVLFKFPAQLHYAPLYSNSPRLCCSCAHPFFRCRPLTNSLPPVATGCEARAVGGFTLGPFCSGLSAMFLLALAFCMGIYLRVFTPLAGPSRAIPCAAMAFLGAPATRLEEDTYYLVSPTTSTAPALNGINWPL